MNGEPTLLSIPAAIRDEIHHQVVMMSGDFLVVEHKYARYDVDIASQYLGHAQLGAMGDAPEMVLLPLLTAHSPFNRVCRQTHSEINALLVGSYHQNIEPHRDIVQAFINRINRAY